MRALTKSDRQRYKRSLAAICAVCAAAGAVFTLSAEKIPVILGKTALSAAQFMYGNYPAEQAESDEPPAAELPGNPDEDIVRTSLPVSGINESSFDDSNMISYGCYGMMPSSENEDPVFIEGSMEAVIDADTDADDGNDRDGTISDTLYGHCTGDDYIDLGGGGQVRNVTGIPNSELISLSEKRPDIKISADGKPEVLIIHTHTTESYETADKDWYDASVGSRSTDPERNVCAVGREIALCLTEKGIGVIHDTTVHDYPSYNGSYDRSRVTAQDILDEYPTVKVVLDIHRDAIERDGERIAPTTEINGRKAAQVMIICGCDGEKSPLPDFRENFKFACLLQSRFESDNPTLTRPVLFDYRYYNQDMTTGSLLIEVGGHANTLDEAKYSGELVGKSLAEALLSLQ